MEENAANSKRRGTAESIYRRVVACIRPANPACWREVLSISTMAVGLERNGGDKWTKGDSKGLKTGH